MGGTLWGQEGNTVSNVIVIQLQPETGEARSFWPDRYSQKGPRGRLFQALQMLVPKEKNTKTNWERKIKDDGSERQEYEWGGHERE